MEQSEEKNNIKYWNEIEYYEVKREKKANVIKYYEEGKEYMWIVSFKITERNSKETCIFTKLQCNKSTLLFYTICTYNKAITRKRYKIYKRIKNKQKRSKCSFDRSTYSNKN